MTRLSKFLILLLCVLFFDTCPAKPTDGIADSGSLNPVQQPKAVSTDAGNNRNQRSPQFGLLDDDYSDYSEEDTEEERGFDLHRKYKFHKHKPSGQYGGYGGYGGYKPPEYYYPSSGGGGGGSFATASAGSIDTHGKPSGGQSHANAQSASFSFGPYSATFSVAEASAGGQKY